MLAEFLQANLSPPYFDEIGRRLWVEASRRTIEPDVRVRRRDRPRDPIGEGSGAGTTATLTRSRPLVVTVPHDERCEIFAEIRIRDGRDSRVVAAIVVLSPGNKTPGEHGRDLYPRKQREVMESTVQQVDLDLLRAGEYTVAVPQDLVARAAGPFHYLASVHRFNRFEDFEVYPIRLEDRLPEIASPLSPGDADVGIDLRAVFDRLYETGPYRLTVEYGKDAVVPPLSADRAAWAARVIAGHAGQAP